jgi:ABC-2 type transport system permease protein
MGRYLVLVRRDLSAYFLSLTGYVILSAALFLMGLSFVVLLVRLQEEPTPMPVTELFYVTQFFWLILVLSTPIITMRLFALEKFSGTYETLMTTPVTDVQVVASKFTAAMVFYMVMWLPLLGCIAIVRHYSGDQHSFDAGTVAATYTGVLLLGGLFISLGCLASSLTQSQVTAGMLSLVFGASVFLLGFVADQAPNPAAPWQAEVLAGFNFFEQMHDFARGVIDTRPVVLLLSLTFLALFLTLRVVESRRWK